MTTDQNAAKRWRAGDRCTLIALNVRSGGHEKFETPVHAVSDAAKVLCAHTEFECDCDCPCGRFEHPENCGWPDCSCGCDAACKGCSLIQEAQGARASRP